MQSQQQKDSFFEHVAHAKQDLDDNAMSSASDSAPSSPELASDSSRGSVASIGTPGSPVTPSSVADSFVFAFDIDGVLVRGGKVIPEAIQAMKVLNGDNEYGIQM